MIDQISALPFPFTSSPFYKSLLGDRSLTPQEIKLLDHYRKYGYILLEECIADETTARHVESDAQKRTEYSATNRLQDGWKQSDAIRSIATNSAVLATLRLLYGREPIPVQTLNFLRGTEQRTHSDVIHFSSLPMGFMCGAWTALEDISINQGPLHYYPESHTLPEFDYYDLGISEESLYSEMPFEGVPDWTNPRTKAKYRLYEDLIDRLMKEHGFKREALTLKRGQTLIWSSNLCHGGNPILDSGSTRKSQVTHFQFEGTIPWVPMFSNSRAGDYHLQPLTNICTGLPVERSYNFMPVDIMPIGRERQYKLRFKSGNNERDAQASLTVDVKNKIDALEREIASLQSEAVELRQTIRDMSGSMSWKVMEPVRQLSKHMSSLKG